MVLLKKKRSIARKNAFLDPYEGQTAPREIGTSHLREHWEVKIEKKSDFWDEDIFSWNNVLSMKKWFCWSKKGLFHEKMHLWTPTRVKRLPGRERHPPERALREVKIEKKKWFLTWEYLVMKRCFKHEKMVLLKRKRFISRKKNAFLGPSEGQTAPRETARSHVESTVKGEIRETKKEILTWKCFVMK